MTILRRHAGSGDRPGGYNFWCPGCDGGHGWNDTWTFDGNVGAPTVNPSLLSRGVGPDGAEVVCHLFIRAGRLEFLSDCTHALAGQTVPMIEWPYAE